MRVFRAAGLVAATGTLLLACGRIGFDELDVRAGGVSGADASAGSGGGGASSGGARGGGASSGAAGTGGARPMVDASAGGASSGGAGGIAGSTNTGGSAGTDAGTSSGGGAGSPVDGGGVDASPCSAVSGDTVFRDKLAAAFPADLADWNQNGGGVCSGSACDGVDFACASGKECGMYSFAPAHPKSGNCASGAVCRLNGEGAPLDFANPMVCATGSTCLVSAYNGGVTGPIVCETGATCVFDAHQGVLTDVTCESGSACFFDCHNGTCSNVVIDAGATALFDCAQSGCRLTCPAGALCAADCTNTNAVDCVACATGADCACFGGTASACGQLCGTDHLPACASPGAERLLSGCWGF
ncbi:MAG TPA: hypothetical protein VHE30_05605 [Polyangiaceae bacterium]|nr:hypothetical protein [Polyangiaceae bacterium]